MARELAWQRKAKEKYEAVIVSLEGDSEAARVARAQFAADLVELVDAGLALPLSVADPSVEHRRAIERAYRAAGKFLDPRRA